ncbi:unnamed protein product [Lupinus luteus]|uniref:Uncharacterized protein n=1 Tax=Lupinus luteus TaxID=3873 RepID=A0AAV1X958_LUPLU
MEFKGSNLIKLLLLTQCLIVLCAYGEDVHFFYFVQQWPGSYCGTVVRNCRHPKNKKPAIDFGIHGLWPGKKDGSTLRYCKPKIDFSASQLAGITSKLERDWPALTCPTKEGSFFWKQQWDKHGVCSNSILNQRAYFELTLDLKEGTNLKRNLSNAGINPDGKTYTLDKIKDALQKAYGFTPFIECYTNNTGHSLLFQVYKCVNAAADSNFHFIECPVRPKVV